MAAGPTIIAKFIADTSKLVSEVDKATSQSGSRLEKFAKGAAIAVGGAFAIAKITQFGKASAEAAASDAEAQAQLATALKNTTGATNAQIAASETYIANLSKQTAIADDELRPALATLARGFHTTADAQKALALATDISAGTGKDLSTVSEALMKAANGNTAALSRLGLATKNADGSAKSLDQVMGDLATTFSGQAAVAASSTAGKMRNASVQMGEFQEQIGTALLPAVAALAGMLTSTLLPALTTVVSFITSHKATMIAALVAIAAMFLLWAANAAIAAAATIAAIAPVLAAAAPFIALGAVIAAVAVLIIKNWDTIVAASKRTWDAVLGAVKFVWDWIKTNWPLLLAIISGPIGVATLLIVKNWETIKSAASALFDWVTGRFKAIGDFIFGIVGSISSAVGRVVDAITRPMNAVIGAWNALEFRIPTFTLPKVHVPGTSIDFGGGTYGGQVIGFPDLPKLARGAVLNSATMFVGGEAGTELVTPEALLRQIIREEGGGASYTLNMYPRTADAADIAYGFRRLELLQGVA